MEQLLHYRGGKSGFIELSILLGLALQSLGIACEEAKTSEQSNKKEKKPPKLAT